ncbi:MAG: hypothetical protein FWC40_00275 [Proteobacteria bacterium]|nr:hypothetical protein [Pseudomonadota bacterium]
MSTQTHYQKHHLILTTLGLLMAICFALIVPKSAQATEDDYFMEDHYFIVPMDMCYEIDSHEFGYFIDEDGECVQRVPKHYVGIDVGVGYLHFLSGSRMQGVNTTLGVGFMLLGNNITKGAVSLFYLEQNLGGGLKGYSGFIGSTLLSVRGFIPLVVKHLLLSLQAGVGAIYSSDGAAFALKLGLGLSVPVTDWMAIGADFSYMLGSGFGSGFDDDIDHILAPSLLVRFSL